MICRFGISDVLAGEELKTWNELTDNARVPMYLTMDIECVPAVGDSVSFELMFGTKIVEVYGDIECRTLTDGRENKASKWQEIYYWFTLKDLHVGWLDSYEGEDAYE